MYNIYLHQPLHKAHRPLFSLIHLISVSHMQHSHTATGIDTIVLYCCTGTVLIKHWEDNNYEISHTIFFFSFHKHICMQVKIYCMSCTKARLQLKKKKKKKKYERQWDTPVQVLKHRVSLDNYTWTGDNKNGHSSLAVAPESWSQSRGWLTVIWAW